MVESDIDLDQVRRTLKATAEKLGDLQEKRNKTVLGLMDIDAGIDDFLTYRFLKVLRKVARKQELEIILESGGGDLDAAAKLSALCKEYFASYDVIVPLYAKSAATYIALAANSVCLLKSGELGPVDPQVRHPSARMWIPAHSIKEALEFIESTDDDLIKLTMADKLDPLLIGAYKDIERATEQYIDEVVGNNGLPKDARAKIVHEFTGKHRSHGYPIVGGLCKSLGINVATLSEELESEILDLHGLYFDLYSDLDLKELSVVQTPKFFDIVIDDHNYTSELIEKPEEDL